MSTNNFAEELVVEIDALTTSYRDMKKKMTEDARVIFTNATKKIFEHYPDLESFGWNQYTPYFNDGDPCVFRVSTYADSLYLNEDRVDDYDDDDEPAEEETTDSETMSNEQRAEIGELLEEFLGLFDDEMFEDWFGDHVTVTIYRETAERKLTNIHTTRKGHEEENRTCR